MSHEEGHFFRRFKSSRSNSVAQDDQEKHRIPNNDDSNQDTSPQDVSWKERIKHFTWAWYTFPMSTGGISVLLAENPHRFPGLTALGKIVYIFDLVVFLTLTTCITTRFMLNPRALRLSLLHPTEALFFPTFFLALVIILLGAQSYGGPATGHWFVVAERVLFWMYCAVTFLVAVGMYFVLFMGKPGRLTVQSMTPGWILPIFPVMLSGTFAGSIAPHQSTLHREAILVAGLTFQGLGWMVSFLMFAIFLHRLMQFGLPAPDLRPGMFIAVGPPSFTAVALISMSSALPSESNYFLSRPSLTISILQSVADFLAIFLWCLAFWFFSIALLSVLHGIRQMSFHLIWYALIFPNVGFTLATISIGRRLESQGILWVGSAMTIALVVVWLFVMGKHAEAVWRRRILMPGVDEDKDEYREGDRERGIPVPPSRWPSPGRMEFGRCSTR